MYLIEFTKLPFIIQTNALVTPQVGQGILNKNSHGQVILKRCKITEYVITHTNTNKFLINMFFTFLQFVLLFNSQFKTSLEFC